MEDYQNVPYIQGLMGDGRPLVEALRTAERDKNNFFKELIGETWVRAEHRGFG